MKTLFGKVIVDSAEVEKLEKYDAVKSELKAYKESEKQRHSRDKHAQLERTIEALDRDYKELDAKYDTVVDERDEAVEKLEELTSREREVDRKEVEAEQKIANVKIMTESAANKARAEAITTAQEVATAALDKVLEHGKFLELPATTNHNQFAGSAKSPF